MNNAHTHPYTPQKSLKNRVLNNLQQILLKYSSLAYDQYVFSTIAPENIYEPTEANRRIYVW